MSSPRYPDFYIIGAPKCGTTALYKYLSEHPSVYMPVSKEPHYFAHDFAEYPRIRDLQSYLSLYCDAPEAALWGEASVWYLFSQVAVAEIMKARPDAKILIVLRNPLDAAEALHAQQVIGFVEDIYDFEQAWRTQDRRATGERVPLHCAEPSHLLYGRVFSYSHQLQRVLKSVPARQMKVIVYEEMFGDPEKTFFDTQVFLGLDPQHRADFERVNARRVARNLFLRRLIGRPPFPLNVAAVSLRWASHRFGLHLGAMANRLMRVGPGRRQQMRPEFRRELDAFFAEDIARMEDMLRRPLNIWRSTDKLAF